LYNGQNYVPQNEQSGANQNIHANIWIVYYTNISSSISAQMDSAPNPPPVERSDESPPEIVEIAREEQCSTEE